MAIFDIDGCEKKLNYVFKDKMLLRKCFTHSSYAYEHGAEDNELLEFFGDAIIQYVVTEYLYKNSRGDEGKLTVKRAEIVSKTPLLKAVKKLGLDEFVLLGNSVKRESSSEQKLYSSIYEAVVAGIYLDGGLRPVKKFIKDTIINDYHKNLENKQIKSVKPEIKNKLQEHVQKNHLGSISYETLSKIGPDHNPEFRVAVLLNGTKIAEGVGQSKKQAQTVSAEKALKKLLLGR